MAPQAGQQSSKSRPLMYWAIFVLAVSLFYRHYVHSVLFTTLGVGRKIENIENFPWSCSRLQHPLLDGCEDMWLDHQGRNLYAACSTVEARQGWSPGGNKYNISARSLNDHVVVIDIDQADAGGLLAPRQLKINGYSGELDLHGFDVRIVDNKPRFWMINHKPSVDSSSGDILDPQTYGANSTIEVFDLDKASDTLLHIKTIASDAIISPNNLAVDSDGVSFVVTNDHNTKTGRFRDLEMLYGTGNLALCRTDTGECRIAAEKGLHFPNGIVKDSNGLYYVSHSASGAITAHKLKDGQLSQVDEILPGYPVDNLSIDEDGTLIAAAIPSAFAFVKATEDPRRVTAPATVLGINIQGGEMRKVLKLAEDSAGEKLPTMTVAIHDVKGERLFLAGGFSPFITICKGVEHYQGRAGDLS